jgi:hypothetical protein
LYWASLALGGVGLALAGESETAGIALVCLALLVLVAARPFARFAPRVRVGARLAATGAVVVGWLLTGLVHWSWGPVDWSVATVISVLAIGRAANPRA